MGVRREMLAAVVEPEDGDGHGVIDGALGLTLAAADEGDALLAAAQQAARADRSEGMLKIGRGSDALERPAGEEPGHGTLKATLIGGTHGFERGRRLPLGLGADLHARGFGLAEAKHRQLQNSILDLGAGGATDDVALLRPDLQQATVALGRGGVVRGGKVKEHLAVFHHHRGGIFGDVAGDEIGNLLRCSARRSSA